MDLFQNIAYNSEIPILAAFFLGLITAISPCPLATNISAIGFISKELENRNKVFIYGLFYTIGRLVSYTVLGVILIYLLRQGSGIYKINKFFNSYGEYFIGPLLLFIGLFMLDVIKIKFSLRSNNGKISEKLTKANNLNSFLMGIIFALAFCPYSGVLYFGGLIPLSVASSGGYFLPAVFAIATGIPVIIFSWILAYSVSSIGKTYNKIKLFELWFRRFVSVTFILIGLYYVWIFFIKNLIL
ncbi:MAG: aromatic aminobenezylarsenical efflux permease ArsG family transporter [Bacteroidales bacterium]